MRVVLAVLAHEMTVAETTRRRGVSAESINRWRNRFVDAGKAGLTRHPSVGALGHGRLPGSYEELVAAR